MGIVRISGPGSAVLQEKLLSYSNERERYPRVMNLCNLVDPEESKVVDRVMAVFFEGPRSYTGEDMLEIHCHGGVRNMNRVLELVLRNGARLAEAGEFTLRAFLNGKLSLSQSQAIVDMIDAESQAALDLAANRLTGGLDRTLFEMREELGEIMAEMEAYLDFPEDEVQPATYSWSTRLHELVEKTHEMEKSAKWHETLMNGLKIVIVGPANAGKSTLFNRLVKERRALVHHEPGTTRDVIREKIELMGLPVLLVDGAGFGHDVSELEKQGFQLLEEELADCFLVLLVIDASKEKQSDIIELLEVIGMKDKIVVLNKQDKGESLEEQDIERIADSCDVVRTSALEGTGINDLERLLKLKLEQVAYNGPFVAAAYQRSALRELGDCLDKTERSLLDGMALDMVAEDLRSAAKILDKLTGMSYDRDLLDRIFSRFCIGK